MSGIADISIFFNHTFIIASILNLYAIPYNSATKILYITYLHFIQYLCIIFAS